MLSEQKNSGKAITFADIEFFIQNHRALHHPLFDYLGKHAATGFTPTQFQIYRDNYFLRTFNTIPCIANLLISVAKNLDFETLAAVGKNLYDETGCGDQLRTHSYLLEFSHNTHAETVFNLKPISLIDSDKSIYLTNEAKQFVNKETRLYTHQMYGTVLGAAYAHEAAASVMLIGFYEGFFTGYKSYYSAKDFYNLSEYFLVHISGLEDAHAKKAREAVIRYSAKENSLFALFNGVSGFLDSQAALWDGLYREIKGAEHVGTKIPPKKLV